MEYPKVKLGEVIKVVSGFAFDSKCFNDTGDGIPLIRIRDVGKNSTETYFSAPYKDEFVVNNGAVLIAMDGEFRVSEWQGGQALLNQRVCCIREINTEKINLRYLLYYLPKELKKIEDVTSFATVKHLSVKQINNLCPNLPPLETQRHIAAVLDRADAVRQQSRQLIAHYDELIQSVFLDMFGDPVRNEKGWEIIALGDFADIVSGVTKNAKLSGDNMVEAPYMRVANVQDGKLDLTEVKTITITRKDYERYILKNGDVLLTEGGDPDKLGRGAVWRGEVSNCIHQNHIFRVRPDKRQANSIYLSALIASRYGKNYFMKAAKQTTGIASINITQLKNFPAFMPPLALQTHFANVVEQIEGQKATAQAELAQAEALFESLLTRAFRGELALAD